MGRNQQVGKETEGRDGNVEDGNEDQRRVLTVFLTTGFCFKGSVFLGSYHSSVFYLLTFLTFCVWAVLLRS